MTDEEKPKIGWLLTFVTGEYSDRIVIPWRIYHDQGKALAEQSRLNDWYLAQRVHKVCGENILGYEERETIHKRYPDYFPLFNGYQAVEYTGCQVNLDTVESYD